ncbi:winged helix-turn-helix domain-containing protein [Sphingomonas sp. RS2018]
MSVGLPVRKLSRLGNELHLTAAIEAMRLFPGHHEWGAVYALLLRRCAGDWVEDERFRAPVAITQSMSIRRISASLHKPYTTIHGYIRGMLDVGAIVEVDGGIALATSAGFARTAIGFMTQAHDSFVRLADDLNGDMSFAAPVRAPSPSLRQMTLVAALDAWLIPFEYAAEPVTDWTSRLIWTVIVVANVRHITLDPVLSDTYAHEPTPDDIRQPIPMRQIIAMTGLSYGTAHRHCKALEAMDVVRQDRGGWLLVSSQLADARIDQGVRMVIDYFHKRITELVAYGFDPADAARFYIGSRPDYVTLEAVA